MKVAQSGFIQSDSDPYVFLDTEEAIESESDILNYLDSLLPGMISSYDVQSNTSATGANIFYEIPNPWLGVHGSPITRIAQSRDFGLLIYPNSFSGSGDNKIGADGVIRLYLDYGVYPRMHIGTSGALAINLNTSTKLNSRNDMHRWVYSSGVVRLKLTWAQHPTVYLQAHPDGSLFLYISSMASQPVLDRVAAGSAMLNYAGRLDSGKMYCIRTQSSTAQGIVYNAAGGVAPNCSVMAFDRTNGKMVGRTKTGPDGAYELLCTAELGSSLFMVCLDDDGITPDFDAQIVDRIIV